MNSDSKHEPSPSSPEWDSWVAAHAPALLLFARQAARSEADAQDLVQEAVLETWRKQADGSPPPLPLVYSTIRRRAIDLARSSTRRSRRESEALSSQPGFWFDCSPEERESTDLLKRAMEGLPEMHRQVITLKIWGGLTFIEIAEALDIPANTAASRYRYGLEALRKEFKETLI